MSRLALTLTLMAALPLAAHAIEYNQVQADKSTVDFGFKQMGVSMDGKFRKFAAQLSFDPAKPEAAKASVDIDLASIDTGSSEGDDEVAGKQWLNTPAFPVARFVSGSVKSLGSNRYEIAGKLTIKGRTRDIVAPVTFAAQGNRGVFTGAFGFKRVDFAIGEGAWAAFDTVANEVQVKFHFEATAAPASASAKK